MVDAVAAIGEPMLVSCGADDCDEDHTIYSPSQLLLVMEGITEEQTPTELTESVELAVENGTLVRGETLTFPTILGLWWDNTYRLSKQN